MTGPIGLHGGGEYLAGDEPFLDALLAAALRATRRRSTRRPADANPGDHEADGRLMGRDVPQIRVAVVPTAAGRGLPDRAAATGVGAFERRAAAAGVTARVEVVRVVDRSSAADEELARRLGEADLIHLPGGDPDLIPMVLDGSPALAAIQTAWRHGAVVAGASAGAMALADWTWTPQGGMHGLGFVHGIAVVPHYDEVRRTTWQRTIDRLAPGGIGYLGLDERTGVLAEPEDADAGVWVVAGEGSAWWFARGASEPVVARSGERLRLPV